MWFLAMCITSLRLWNRPMEWSEQTSPIFKYILKYKYACIYNFFNQKLYVFCKQYLISEWSPKVGLANYDIYACPATCFFLLDHSLTRPSTCCLWLLWHYNGRVEELWQSPYVPQTKNTYHRVPYRKICQLLS